MLSALQLWRCLSLLALALLVPGCAGTGHPPAPRAYSFCQDTFAYTNELVWEYAWDAQGRWRGEPRTPKPDYSHRCFVVAKAAKQFFGHAQFDPHLGPADDLTYRRLIREVLRSSPRQIAPAEDRIRVPGYRSLRQFSVDQERLLKAESGGPWRSYFQRGHWRMIFPFSRGSQARTARNLIKAVRENRPAVVHVVTFPSLRINHALLVFAALEDSARITFQVYDPNTPDHPGELSFDRATRTFHFPTTAYFPGGNVNVYEVYHALLY